MNIDELQAGRELDMLIAEKVLRLPGTQPGNQNQFCEHAYFFKAQNPAEYYWNHKEDSDSFVLIPCYSTDIAAAWQVVEKCNLLDAFNVLRRDVEGNKWTIVEDMGYGDWGNYTSASTVPLVICRAALKAVME